MAVRSDYYRRAGLILASAMFTACGGGSGTAQSVPPGGALPPTPAPMVRAEFTASSADMANPERGFYRAASSDLDRLSAANVADAYAAGHRLMYARINLEPYRDADIPFEYLDRLATAFATARQGGVKLIVRATYNYPRGETEYRDAKDASLSRVKGHLAQLTPLLHDNVDVISVMQAGFIGAWGEWHTSSNDLTTPENRTQIKDALLEAVPATRFIQFRYPPYIRDWSPTLPNLDAAISGAFRIGFHNDCFLASTTDVGTYNENATVRAVEQQYNDDLGDLAPFGGETCNPADEASPTPRTTCDDILTEGARYNLTYLNDSYYRPLFHTSWINQGCMAEVRNRMGYRFTLVSAAHPRTVTRNDRLELSLVVRNSGWARLYNPRTVQVVLRNPASGAVHRLDASTADPRRWLPGQDTAQTLSIPIPASIPAGTYDMWLALPDADDRLKADRRYAIRLANGDNTAKGQVWDDSLAAFALGTSLEIR